MSAPHDEGPQIRRAPGAESGDNLATVVLDDLTRPRPPNRGRAWRTAAVVALVALVAVGILHGFTSGGGGGTVSVAPTATADDPGLLVESNVNYGTLTLNGKPVSGSPPLIVKPRPGDNTLTLSAPPFNPHTCRLRWPAGPRDVSISGCDRGSASGAVIRGQTLGEIQFIQLTLSGDDLPPDLQAAALSALTHALSSVHFKTTVPAGDYIATGRDDQGHITSVRAATSLRSALSFTLTPPGSPGFRVCGGILCGVPGGFARATDTAHLWSVSVPVSARWQFGADSGGQAISTDAPLDSSIPLNLSYDDSASSWQVGLPDTHLLNASRLDDDLLLNLCSGGSAQLFEIAQTRQLTAGQLSDHGVEGCLIVTAPNGAFFPGLGTPPPPDDGQFVWRFGVLLAANAAAHTLAPDLPLAPPDEIKTVAA
jgi:hypothetical protein